MYAVEVRDHRSDEGMRLADADTRQRALHPSEPERLPS